jgi:hypothetical protein
MSEQPVIVDTRDEQRYPKLQPQEIERLRRFGEVRPRCGAVARAGRGSL